MKRSYSYLALSFLLLLSGINGYGQAVNPTDNVPDSTSPAAPPQVTSFPGLVDFNAIVNRNYVRSYDPQQPTQNAASVNMGITQTTTQSITNTAYLDGLGRPLQEVQKSGLIGNTLTDIVTVHAYDAAGNEPYKYMPYSYSDNFGRLKANPKTQLSGFYDNLYPGDQPYAQTVTDNSPLSKPLKVYPPGNTWVGSSRGVVNRYGTNALLSGGDYVPNWNVGMVNTDPPQFNGYYSVGDLTALQTTNEDGAISVEYKNKLGQVVCKRSKIANLTSTSFQPGDWAQTCYVYDDMGQLRYVLSPEAIRQSMPSGWQSATSWPVSSAILDGLCYRYYYDQRGRNMEKKLPGKGVEYMVYDTRDRLVFTQDNNLRAAGKWSFTIYDDLNRPMMTGLYTSAAPQSQLASNLSDASTYAAPDIRYYMKQASLMYNYPPALTSAEVLGYTYYDDYANIPGAVFNTNYFPGHLTGLASYGSLTPTPGFLYNGLVTGTKVKVIDGAATPVWISTTNFYDEKGRLIQQLSNNIKGGNDQLTNQYDFRGTLVSSFTVHENPAALSPDPNAPDLHKLERVARRYNKKYPNDAIFKLELNINDAGWRTVYDQYYDNLNRMKSKNLSSADHTYNYNIRGWLTGINNEYIDDVNPVNRFFFETLSYDQGHKSKLYSGNIAGITWKNSGAGALKRSYGYTYDPISRLQHAEFREYGSTGWSNAQTDFTASNISYDLNGNIQAMNQRGPGYLNGGTLSVVDMDKMTYTYAANSNKLMSVTESNSGVTTNGPDFQDGNTAGNDYDYDLNGNMKQDLNKGITYLSYTYLNKPDSIVVTNPVTHALKGKIKYIYDATGRKLRMKAWDATGHLDVTDYLGAFVYRNDSLQYMIHEEGRCRPKSTVGNNGYAVFDYDYFVKDHLGNVRSTINAQASGIGPTLSYHAGMEVALSNLESAIWNNVDEMRTAKPGTSDPSDTKAAELIGADPAKRIGPALMLRVMPGDRFTLSAETFYDAVGDNNTITANDIAGSLLTALSGGITNVGRPVSELPENIRIIRNGIGGPNFAGITDGLMRDNYDRNKPAAYLNYVVMDQNFRVVKENSGAMQMSGDPSTWNVLATPAEVTIGQTGYLAVYASSKTVRSTFFDKFNLTFYKGSVLDENHYYPFGLTLTNPNPPTVAAEKNNYKLTTKELQDNFNVNLYDFGARMQDEQTGRWLQVDPKAEKYLPESPYNYAGNNPAFFVDKAGEDKHSYYTVVTDVGTATLMITIPNIVTARPARNFFSGDDFYDVEEHYTLDLRKNTPNDQRFSYEISNGYAVSDGMTQYRDHFLSMFDQGTDMPTHFKREFSTDHGIHWYSSSGQGWETKRGTADAMENLDDIMTILGNYGGSGGVGQFEHWAEVLDNFTKTADLGHTLVDKATRHDEDRERAAAEAANNRHKAETMFIDTSWNSWWKWFYEQHKNDPNVNIILYNDPFKEKK